MYRDSARIIERYLTACLEKTAKSDRELAKRIDEAWKAVRKAAWEKEDDR